MAQSVFVHVAAELLGVSRRTIYYRIRDGKLRTVRTRCGTQRVLLDSIQELLREEAGLATDPDADVSDTGLSERCPAP